MVASKQQFNVYLDPALVKAAKRASLDRQQSLSELVAEALRGHLEVGGREARSPEPSLLPLPILFVRDLRASLKVCQLLGFRLRARSRNGQWAELESGGSALALHGVDPSEPQRVDLSLESTGPLEALAERLSSEGIAVGEIIDEGFGRWMTVQIPDGLTLRIDEPDRTLYL